MTNKTTKDGKQERNDKKKLKGQSKKTFLNKKNFRKSRKEEIIKKIIEENVQARGIHQYLA